MSQLFTILAPRGRDAAVILQLMQRAGLKAQVCPDLASVPPLLEASAAVMVTEETLTGPALEPLLEWIERQPAWSDLAFIVLATKQGQPRSPSHRAVLDRLGNSVLLERPLNADTLVSAARAALRARRRQLAMRDLTDTLETRVIERTTALAASEERFRATFEGFPECLFVVTVEPDGRFLFERYNPAAGRRTGLQPEQSLGRTAAEFMGAEQGGTLEAQFARCVAEATGIAFTEELDFPAGRGTFDCTLTPMRDPDGAIPWLLLVARDVTERNRIEQRVRAAQKLEAIGQLTGGVAHDFNNLLQVVLSGLTLMDRLRDPERRAQVVESVRRAAQRGGELTRRLLTIARKGALRPAAIDLGAWVSGGFSELLARTLRGDILIEVQIPPGLPAVEVDPAELELAVLNLAVNSRDAMPQGGTLRLSADLVEVDEVTDPDGLVGEFVRLSVTDTGQGMAPDVQARVFEPFFTTKEMGKGTGLGLAQVYGFARQSGGGVRLRSAPGEGTTVSLLLPLAPEAAPAPALDPEPDAKPAGRASVLVCEDDDEVAKVVVDMLIQLGHAPVRVNTAADALGALAGGRTVDLLFTDVMMPGGMDGLALAREAGRRRPGLPVLLTTGYTGGGPEAEPLGVPLLRKPYRIDDLAKALDRALNAA